jgi:hypothetical protein
MDKMDILCLLSVLGDFGTLIILIPREKSGDPKSGEYVNTSLSPLVLSVADTIVHLSH